MTRAWFACVLAGIPWAAPAAGGELKYVACPGDLAIEPRTWHASSQEFRKPDPGMGTVHRGAVTVPLRCGRREILVAIDSRKPDAKAPDVVRFDLAGKGRFDDASAADLTVLVTRPDQQAFSARFGPVTLEMDRGGKTILVTVRGEYSKQLQFRWVQATFTVAAEAKCRFGDKICPVRIIDGTGNLAIGDAAASIQRDGKIVGIQKGDTVAVGAADGSFADSPKRTFYGQPVFLNDAWYRVKLSPDGREMSAEPVEGPTGYVRADCQKWQALLVGRKYLIPVEGTRQPLPVPADQYAVRNYTEYAWRRVRGEPARTARFTCSGRREMYLGLARMYDVPAGKTTELKFGSPLTADLSVRKSGRTVRFALDLKGAGGAQVDSISVPPRSDRPEPPRIEVLDKAGKRLYQGSMRYG